MFNSVESPVMRLVYQPMPISSRIQFIGKVESIIQPTAIFLISVFLLFSEEKSYLNISTTILTITLLSILWIVIAVILSNEYRNLENHDRERTK